MAEIIITSSVLIACVLLLRLALHKKLSRRLQYAMWLIVVLRLLIPVSLSAPVSVMNAFENLGKQAAAAEPIVGEALPRQPDNIAAEPIINADEQPVADNMTEAVPPSPDHIQKPQAAPEAVLKIIWLIGTVTVSLWLLCVNIIFQIKLKKNRIPYSCYGSKLPVYVTTKLQTPCMSGLFKPAIYITPQVTENPQTLRHVITHELCHYSQLDHIWSVVRIVCIALYWFNPLVWAAAVCSRSDCELACDELAVKRLGESDKLNYGKTLVELVQSRPSFSSLSCTATTMAANKSQIKKRINLIVKSPKTIVWALVVLVLALAAVAACTFTGAEKNKNEAKILSVKTLKTLGLTASLPDGMIINDPNYDKEANKDALVWEAYENVTVDNFNITMPVLDQKSLSLSAEIPVLHINAFEWSEGAPEDYTYRLVGKNAGDKTYEEIKPYIIYEDNSRLVVEISAFTGENYKADMEKYIETNKDKPRNTENGAPVTELLFANGTDVYDYAWLNNAFDMIAANKNRLIVPEPTKQGLTQTMTFEFPARKITNPNGLPIIDEINATEKFYLKATLPNNWTTQGYKEIYEETVPMGDFYTPEYIYDLSGAGEEKKLLGYIGFNTFEPYGDEMQIPEADYYKTVYPNLRLSSMCVWDPYKPVKATENGETGVAMIQYKDPEAIKASPEKTMAEIPNLETWGILCYDKALGVYTGIAFNPGTVDMEEAVKIAETVEILPAKPEKPILIGKNLSSAGLTVSLPKGVRLQDPNFVPLTGEELEVYGNVKSYLQYSVRMPVNDAELMVNELAVLNVNAFVLGEGKNVFDYRYKIQGGNGEDIIVTYPELGHYIIYRDKTRFVVETSELIGSDLRADMEKYIEEHKNDENPNKNYINGKKTYDYSWLPDAFDLIEKHKDLLVMPKEQTGEQDETFKKTAYSTYDKTWSFSEILDESYVPPLEAGGDKYLHEASAIRINTKSGENILSMKSGKVVCTEYLTGFGKSVAVIHDDGTSAIYGHCSEYCCKVGDSVKQGETIAKTGSSGNTPSPALIIAVFNSKGYSLLSENSETNIPQRTFDWYLSVAADAA